MTDAEYNQHIRTIRELSAKAIAQCTMIVTSWPQWKRDATEQILRLKLNRPTELDNWQKDGF